MNKFKKILLGAVSVLTLGLFVVTGNKVTAAEVAGTDYWELYRSGDSTTVNTNNYFTLSELTDKSQTVTNTSGFTKHDGTALANLNRNWQIASGDSKKITFTTGDNADGYTLEILMVGNKANSNVLLNGNSLANVNATNLEKVTSSLNKSTEYTISKGTNSNYIHYICVYKAIVSSSSYTLNYDSNGHGTAPDSVSDVNALTSTLLNKTITGVDGYRFDGWYMDSSCQTAATTNTNLDSYAANSAVTLYAKWVQVKNISFYDPEDTTTAIKTESFDYGVSIGYVPTKENATFEGWYTDVELTNPLSSLVVGESTPTTLYAKLTSLSYSGNPNALNATYLEGAYVPTTAVASKTNLTGLNFFLMKDLYKQTIQINNTNTNVINLGGTGSPSTSRTLGFNAQAKGILKVQVYATGDRQWAVYDTESKADIFVSETLVKNEVHEIVVNLDANKTYEIYCKNNKCYIVSAVFIETSVSTPVLEQQENANNTAIRYIATLSNVSDIDEIVSWNATITVGTRSHTFANQTAVYSAVAGTNGKGALANTYYLVATLSGIPTTFTGTIKCQFSVTLTNGTVQSNIISYTIA